MLENLVFEQLLRSDNEIYYWKSKNGNEVDFVIRDRTKITRAYQVTYAVTPENRKRELQGLFAILKEIGDLELKIITYDQEETIVEEGKNIQVIPIWKWLLNLAA